MQQVLDFFELLTADEDKQSFVWNLTYAATNSPFSAEAEAVSLDPDVDVRAIAATRIREAADYVGSLSSGVMPTRRLTKKRADAARKIFRRNIQGIGRTTATFGPAKERQFLVTPKVAAVALATVEDDEKGAPDYLPAKRDRMEVGSVEGYLEDVGTDYGVPAIHIIERKSNRRIACRVDQTLMDSIAQSADFKDVWDHRRVMVRGRVFYGTDGTIARVIARSITRVTPRQMTLHDVEDEKFTDGLPTGEYIRRLREGEIG